MRYASAAALRDALDQRLVEQANETGVDIGRLRRRVVFERLLVRFALAGEGRWVVKGGVAVELRLTDRARTTRDLDLALRGVEVDGLQIRDSLAEALLSNPQQDYFEFRIDRFRPTSMDGAPSPVWRASLDARLDGRTFDRVVTDIVVGEPDTGRVELLPLPGTLSFAGLVTVKILTVDLNQHFADKLHAMVRHRGERRSTRVKDLADLVLFIATGYEPTSDLVQAVSDVFASTGDPLPDHIPDPPVEWEARYEELALELHLAEPTVAVAMAGVREFWSHARSLASEADHAAID
jgi:hypothetical protein